MEHIQVFYDGECGLCAFWVSFLLKRDRSDRFRFAALQSGYATDSGIASPSEITPDTVIVLHEGRQLTHSDAALTMLAELGGGWNIFRLGFYIPRFIRDGVYRFIARYRFLIWGKNTSCLMPKPEWRSKFLDESF